MPLPDAGLGPDEKLSEALLSFMYMCPSGILQIEESGSVQMLNPMASQILMPVAPGGRIDNLFDALRHCAPELRNLLSAHEAPHGAICEDHRIFVSETAEGPHVLACTLLRIEPGCIMAMLHDVSRQVSQERQLTQAESWLTSIFNHAGDFACFHLDVDGSVVTWNLSGVRQTGFDQDEMIGRPLGALFADTATASAQVMAALQSARREGFHLHEGRCRRRDGGELWCQILITAVREDSGLICGFSVVLRDVNERKITADQLRRLLTTDHLTGAANRAHLFESAAALVDGWRATRAPVSVVMLDADHFKHVNDTFGHAVGDLVLQGLVARWRPVLRTGDILARFGGEEFVILLPGTNLAGAAELAERLRVATADRPIACDDVAVAVTVSIGAACLGPEVEAFNPLLKAADAALYRAKQSGRNRVCLAAASVAAPVRHAADDPVR